MASRVIVKNLPVHATEERLRERFAAFGEVTDCRLKSTKDGRSRGFGFVGFRRPEEAQEAIKQLNRSFFDTSRIAVEAAHAPGSQALARPWSRYAAGSSAHLKRQERQQAAADKAAGRKPAEPAGKLVQKKTKQAYAAVAPKGARRVKTALVRAGKAGVRSERVHVEFASESSGEEGGEKEEVDSKAAEPPRLDKVAFDEELSDLAYLRRKSAAAAATTTGEGPDPADSNGTTVCKKKKKKAGKAKAAVEKEVQDTGAPPPAGAGADPPAGEKEAAPADAAPTGADDEDADATGRLYITNLPYGTTEEELRGHFETLGEVSSVYVCKDEDTLKSRGFGYVTYVFPECAVRAQAELDLQPFQGRVLRVAPARPKPEPAPAAQAGDKAALRGGKSSYKRGLLDRQKRVDAHLEHTWNLLYVSANAAADAAAKQLGVAKGELFGKDAENMGLTAALTETSIIQQTKRWLQKEGIRVDAFEQAGATLAKSRAIDAPGGKRRDDTFIVKHLPAGAKGPELRERFARYGELVRCSLAPSGTVAVVQYTDQAGAQRAFQKLAFSRYMHVPLYLEWAPEDVFVAAAPATAGALDETAGGSSGSTAGAKQAAEQADGAKAAQGEAEAADAEEEGPRGCLFAKNLNFATTDEGLRSAFKGCPGFRSAVVMKKKAAVAKGKGEAQQQSMGYGFVEFDSPASAAEALKRKQGVLLDGHAVQLAISQRRGGGPRGASAEGPRPATKAGALKTQRLCVRNLAFEATREELRRLFGAYGAVTAVRLPRKSDYSGHRGFAFVDFASKSEAAAAFEALQHTHLYGRRMVIEPAEEAATDVGTAQRAAEKRQAAQTVHSESKRRRRAGVLNASGEAGSFQDAFA